ncbi:MAG: hypothetical protein IJ440_05595 [Alphaproteobacteria bacterium]|nr:hypothetical protein [Alphaproteobacteria bacterium]
MKILNTFFYGYFKQKTAETGRSMVEMLGVLMLMGFLSVGGVLTFRYVMTYYQAGEIQEAVTQAKVLVSTRQVRTLSRLQKFLNKTSLKAYETALEIQDIELNQYMPHRVYKVILKNISPKLQQAIYARKDNFAKMDIMVSPDESVEADQSLGSWIEAGMKEEIFDIFSQAGLITNQVSQEIAISFVRKVRIAGVVDLPVSGLLPSECPADMPYYDSLTDTCLKCNPETNAHWQDETQSCVICNEPKTVWDNVTQNCECPLDLYGDNCEPCDLPKEWRENACQCPIGEYEKNDTCVECLENSHCTGLTPVCNSSNFCEACPSEFVWRENACQCPIGEYEKNNTCVKCLENSHCNTTNPICDGATNICKTCYDVYGTSAPYWDAVSQQCVPCPDGGTFDATKKKCIIVLAESGFDWCPWGPAPGCKFAVKNFGSYTHNYTIYVTGYVDDEIRYYKNSTNIYEGYNTWCNNIDGLISKKNSYGVLLEGYKMGELDVGSYGDILIYSSSGCIYWKKPGKIWLELID